MTAHDLTGWQRQIPLRFWLVLVSLSIYLLWRTRKSLADWRKRQIAKNWPTVEGCAIYAHVMNAVLENKPESYSASFTYYFSLNKNGETEYYSGEFSRLFSEEEQAQEWLNSLKERKIPVHYQPDDPNVSAVLFDDLVAKFPIPLPAMVGGRLVEPGTVSKQPYILRWPTEMMALLTGLGFCLGLVDHLFRVFADRPVYPKLAIFLWTTFAVVVIPFESWFHWKSGGYSFDPRTARNKAPLSLRLLTHLFNIYVAIGWLFKGTHFFEHFQLHRERFDPVFNGAFLALVLGNYAASLYRRLENIEESPVSSALSPYPE